MWKDPRNQDDEHHLFYGAKGRDSRELLRFGRYVCIHWSPDEKYFSVSNYIGSNVAEAYIFQSGDTSRQINVMDLLPPEVANFFRKGISHGYLETLSWDNYGLIVRAFGDRDDTPREFDITLRCTVEREKWTCKKTEANN